MRMHIFPKKQISCNKYGWYFMVTKIKNSKKTIHRVNINNRFGFKKKKLQIYLLYSIRKNKRIKTIIKK